MAHTHPLGLMSVSFLGWKTRQVVESIPGEDMFDAVMLMHCFLTCILESSVKPVPDCSLLRPVSMKASLSPRSRGCARPHGGSGDTGRVPRCLSSQNWSISQQERETVVRCCYGFPSSNILDFWTS